MLCQRDGGCDEFVGWLVGDERAIPDHVCLPVMRAACASWFRYNSEETVSGRSVAFIGDNLRVKGTLDSQRELTDWPIPVDGHFDITPCLAHVIRHWVLAPRGTPEDAIKSERLFHAQPTVNEYMAQLRIRLQTYISTEHYEGPENRQGTPIEAVISHFSITALYLAKRYGMPYDPGTIRFAASETLRAAGYAVPQGVFPSRGVLVTTFILVHDPADIFSDPQAHQILHRIEHRPDSTKELRKTADKVADKHAKWWRAQYPVTRPRLDLRRFNSDKRADNDRDMDIKAHLDGQINRQTVYANAIERWTQDEGSTPTETEIERLKGTIRTQISRFKKRL
jgi:hypothetical protein